MLKKGLSLRMMGMSQEDPNYHPLVNKNASLRSSEWAACWGLSPYISKVKYWRILKGKQARDSPPAQLPCLQHGKDEEPISAMLFQEKYLNKGLGFKYFKLQEFGARQYWEDPIYSASPDRLLVNPEGGVECGLEIKNPWSKEIPRSVGVGWNLELSHRVLQCFLCMAIFEVESWFLFYTKSKTKESSLFVVHWNKEFWEKSLYPQSREFYNSTQPPPDRMANREKDKNADWIMSNIRVVLIEYCPPICEED